MGIGKYIAIAALCAGVGMYAVNCSDSNKNTYKDAEKKIEKTYKGIDKTIDNAVEDIKKKTEEGQEAVGDFIEDIGK